LIDPRVDLGSQPRSLLLRESWLFPNHNKFPDPDKIRSLQRWYESVGEFGENSPAQLPWEDSAPNH
jgi:hypothetical protein